jgi:N6-adenosine-specific RNA methylase IME4
MTFECILCDPPWTYDDKALAGDRGAGCKYALMSDQALRLLPVEMLAADDCVLFMWATMPKLREALDLGTAWGFTYKTCAFTWVKTTPAFDALLKWVGDKSILNVLRLAAVLKALNTLWFIGMGRWTRANAELVLLFVKGKPSRLNAGVNQVIAAPPGRHSEKPAETRDRIVQLMGDKSRVELFARDVAPGWMALGGDLDGGQDLWDTIPALAEL